MKRAIKHILGAIASVWAGIIGLVKRFNWQEAKNVEETTLMNAMFVVVFYSLTLVCICAALFWGAWHQLALGFITYIMGAVLMQDKQWGNETACHYFERMFSKK